MTKLQNYKITKLQKKEIGSKSQFFPTLFLS